MTAVSPRATYRSVVGLGALLLLPALAYAGGVLLPYASRGTGADDAGWLGLLGVYSLILAPLAALVALAGCALHLLPRSGRRLPAGIAVGLAVVALLCVAFLAFLLSPLGRAVTTWAQD